MSNLKKRIKANKWTYILIIVGIAFAVTLFVLSGNNRNNRKALDGAYNDLIDYHKKRGEILKNLKEEGKIDSERYARDIKSIDAKIANVEKKIDQASLDELTDKLNKI